MGYMLETRGLTKRFGRGDQAQEAVTDVSLHIREGEVYGLLGPNGAGKSTTLKMICGPSGPRSCAPRSRPIDLCQDFGHASSRNQAAIGMASGLGSVLSKKAAMASAGTL